MASIPLDHEIFAPYFMSLDMFQCLLVYSLWELECRICILLLSEKCINLNYAELIHSAFQAYYILLLLCVFILIIFECLILKRQLQILIYLPKRIIIIYSGRTCSSVFSKSPVNVLSYFHNLKKKNKKGKEKKLVF